MISTYSGDSAALPRRTRLPRAMGCLMRLLFMTASLQSARSRGNNRGVEALPGQLHCGMWVRDVGSVAIEWMRAPGRPQAIAIEHHRDRAAMIAGNAASMGVPDLRVVIGDAVCLKELPLPTQFSLWRWWTSLDLLRDCWNALQKWRAACCQCRHC